MTTTAELIAETRRHLMSSGREHLNRLNGNITNVAGTLTFEFPAGQIAAGALIAIDLEVMYVWSVTGSVATVQRGMFGSAAAAHSDDALIFVNPLFTDYSIFKSLGEEFVGLSSPLNGLYRVKTVTATATSASTYNLASDVVEILSVQYNEYGSSLDWPRLRRWDLLLNQDTAVFASGRALQLYAAPAAGRTLRITYAAEFSALTSTSVDVATDTGLPAGAHDIPPIGAAGRLLAAREARRSSLDSQPESRQAQEVPPGTARSASAQLFALRKQRIVEEAARLSAQWPTVMRPAV